MEKYKDSIGRILLIFEKEEYENAKQIYKIGKEIIAFYDPQDISSKKVTLLLERL